MLINRNNEKNIKKINNIKYQFTKNIKITEMLKCLTKQIYFVYNGKERKDI